MPGFKMYVGGGLGGVEDVRAAQYGGRKSYSSGSGAGSAAFVGPATTPTYGAREMLTPNDGFGLALWIGIGSIVVLWAVRASLPG